MADAPYPMDPDPDPRAVLPRFALGTALIAAMALTMAGWVAAPVAAVGIRALTLNAVASSAVAVFCLPLLLGLRTRPRRVRLRRAHVVEAGEPGLVLRASWGPLCAVPAASLAVGLYCGWLVLTCWSVGVPQRVGLHQVLALRLAMVLAVVGLGYAGACLVAIARGRLSPGWLALTPSGIHHRSHAWAAFVPWSDVLAIVVGPTADRPVWITGGADGRVRRTSRLLRDGAGRPEDERITVPAARLVPDPDRLAQAIALFAAYAELRPGLAEDDRDADRLRVWLSAGAD